MSGTREETDGAIVWTVVFVTLAVIGVILAAGKLLLMKVYILLKTDALLLL